MAQQRKPVQWAWVMATVFSASLSACFSSSQDNPSSTPSTNTNANNTNNNTNASGANDVVQTMIAKATCGTADNPEKGLQGQVPLTDRVQGYKGNNCNLTLVGQSEGEGASWQHASYKNCAYYGQAYAATALTPGGVPRPSLKTPGTVIVDMTDSTKPTVVGHLQSVSMLDPWESLKVNEKRGLLAAVNGTSSGMGGPQFDVYDISKDCTKPEVLYSGSLSDTTLVGHEGNWAPDGMTYYGGDATKNGSYYAIDVSNPRAPKFITKFKPPLAVHGLSISDDGTRGYVALSGSSPDTSTGKISNGFGIYDLTPISTRAADPTPKLLTKVLWDDGSIAQHTIPVTIAGKKYVISVDENGSGGATGAGSKIVNCASGKIPYGIPRIFDVTDETAPVLVSKLILEVNQPVNCVQASMDTTGMVIFGYDSHYCSVDDTNNATLLACGFFNSGLRLFDIRNPHQVKEIGYYNPAMKAGQKGGSTFNLTGNCFSADWTSSRPRIVKERGEIWFTSQCAGFQAVKMSSSIYPLN